MRSPYIYVDVHIMATPAIGDLDGDGVDELVVPVSYFFDKEYYAQEVWYCCFGAALVGLPFNACAAHPTLRADARTRPVLLPTH